MKKWISNQDASDETKAVVAKIVRCMVSRTYPDKATFTKALNQAKRDNKLFAKNSLVAHVYQEMEARGEVDPHPQLLLLLRTKVGKSASGILSITVFTSPYPEYTDDQGRRRKQRFSCQVLPARWRAT